MAQAQTMSPPASDQNDPPPRLSLSVDTPPSSSPFPSPSSSFLPPPMPGAHEFALPPASARKKTPSGGSAPNSANSTSTNEPNVRSPLSAGARAGEDASKNERKDELENEKTGKGTTSMNALALQDDTTDSNTATPMPTPTSSDAFDPRPSEPSTPTNANTSLPASTTDSPHAQNTASPSQKIEQDAEKRLRDSLPPTRPAPPSPAVSRRTSMANPPSRSNSRPTSFQRTDSGSGPASFHRANSSSRRHTQGSFSVKKKKPGVKVRDFAFPPADDRHTGLGPETPKPNRPAKLNRISTLSSASTASASSSQGGEDEDEDADGGWGKWAFGRMSQWGVGRMSSRLSSIQSSSAMGEGEFPSETDFARNFEPEEDEDGEGGEEEWEDAEGGEEWDDGAVGGEEGPLLPGVYRALYSFEPEGTAEMGLREEQEVRVIGRGGGVGWAVVVREDAPDGAEKRHALVPESYLEVVRLDQDGEHAPGQGQVKGRDVHDRAPGPVEGREGEEAGG